MTSAKDSYTWSPTSPSSGVGTLDSRGYAYPPTDDNLPEVVPGSTPTTVTRTEDGYKEREPGEERDPKYPVIYDNTPKYPSTPQSMSDVPPTSPYSSVPWEPLSAIEEQSPASFGDGRKQSSEDRRICGLSRKIFLLVILAAVVLVAAAIGGGVGGGLAAKSRESTGSGSATTSSSTSPTSTSSTGTTSTTTSSASPTPTFLNNSTLGSGSDGFKFQAFQDTNYQGNATTIITQEGFTDLGMHANSYVWLPNNTGCCVTFCQNETSTGGTGWWCGQRYQPAASGWFARIFIGCGDQASEANSRCS